mgnify:CR=1 FL=1
MKLVSYNVNGIRAAIKKGLIEWIKEVNADIICIQETKSQPDQVPADIFEELGYTAHWHSAEKKGYSGVMTLSKKKPSKVIAGISMADYDSEGRVLRTDFGSMTLLNCYFPSGSSSDHRHDFKMKFLNDFRPWVTELLQKRKKVIIVGDYNIVRLDIDIHNPQRKDKPSGYKPEEREWLAEWFDTDFDDAYRHLYPEQEDVYSWWSYRAGSRQKNKGWRIDYISVSKNISKKISEVRHATEAVQSDHVPVMMTIDIK